MQWIWLWLLLIAPSASADEPSPKGELGSAPATVHVIQPSGQYCAGAGWCGDDRHPYLPVFMDGALVGELVDGYFHGRVATGTHEIVVGVYQLFGRHGPMRRVSVKLDAKPGERYYYRVLRFNASPDTQRFYPGEKVDEITEAAGRLLLGKRALPESPEP
jgi:hypothetical protein